VRVEERLEAFASALAGRYAIERELGAGGMAWVLLARDLRHDRAVAIKVMRPELAPALGAERFLREIRLLAGLQHPHILGLVDSGEAGGLLYYVMPYLPEGSLRERLSRERELPIREAMRILREVADALAHAHAAGIVHRDIKPENVLFAAGHAQVADFGIARIVGSAAAPASLTATGIVIGSPAYLSPEQATADPRMDHRADLYAFGVMAYEMLAGQPPFTAGAASQLLAMHLHESPEPLSRRRPSVPAGLEALVMRCLEKRPADRWGSAGELIARLDGLGADHGVTATAGPKPIEPARFPITEALARGLDRDAFDPRIIGDALEYLDNRHASDVLVVLVHAVGLDSSDFAPHLAALPYRCIAPTLYGYEPRPRYRMRLCLEDHGVLLAGLVRQVVAEARPAHLILVGFSSAADIIMRLAASPRFDAGRAVDGILALGCNQGRETCFVTRVLSKLDGHDVGKLLQALRTVGDAAGDLDDWLVIHDYLGRIMTKFRYDVGPLRALAAEIADPFLRDDSEAFPPMYRAAAAGTRLLHCLFEDSEICNRLLRKALLDNMDRKVLGERYREGSLRLEPSPRHFHLIEPATVACQLAAMVEELRAPAS
jgi:hypothetical protein